MKAECDKLSQCSRRLRRAFTLALPSVHLDLETIEYFAGMLCDEEIVIIIIVIIISMYYTNDNAAHY